MSQDELSDGDASPAEKRGSGKSAFRNSDAYLREQIPKVLDERKELGLSGIVGGLDYIIVNTERENQRPAVEELLRYTGYNVVKSFVCPVRYITLMSCKGSADILVTSRVKVVNPFKGFNNAPKSAALPNTRIERLVFRVKDIERFYETQKEMGIAFSPGGVGHEDHFSAVQTMPLPATGTSIGFVQWKGGERDYMSEGDEELDWKFEKPDRPHLKNIGFLDHMAQRVHAADRDRAILDFMRLTNYDFDFAIYVERLNSITNVARLSKKDYAMVFTSGISPYADGKPSGPTEKFIHNYGPRVHHMAFRTSKIEDTFESLKEDGMRFLIDLVGSPGEGLKQTFSRHSPNTLVVNEYIHRYGDFDGFFTKSNVTDLTRVTGKQ